MSAATQTESHTARNLYDVHEVRKDFPILHQEVNGHPLVYLDNGATSQKPRTVIDAVRHYYERDNANVHRGVHTLSERATNDYEGARDIAQRFINASDRAEIILVRGTTEGINLVAQGYGRPRLKEGDEIIISTMEHHSNIVPWQLLCEEVGATLKVVPIDDRGELILDELDRLLSERTRLFALSYISNALGTINPIRRIIDLSHRRGVPVVIDGAQAVPHISVDVRDLGCDFFAFSGHKMFAPTGIGVLYGRRELLEEMPPYQGGGEMIRSVSFEKTEFASPPARFEAGTPNIAGAVALGAAIDYLDGLGMGAIGKHEQQLLDYATELLVGIPGLRLIGTAEHKAGVLSFVIDGIHAHDVGTVLDQEGIAVRAGHHCAQPVMTRFGVPATARASFALYNTPQEADRLAAGIARVKEVFG